MLYYITVYHFLPPHSRSGFFEIQLRGNGLLLSTTLVQACRLMRPKSYVGLITTHAGNSPHVWSYVLETQQNHERHPLFCSCSAPNVNQSSIQLELSLNAQNKAPADKDGNWFQAVRHSTLFRGILSHLSLDQTHRPTLRCGLIVGLL